MVAIVATLLGLLLPAVQQVRESAARASCASNLRQLATAVHLYAEIHHRLPKGCDYPLTRSLAQVRSQPGVSWHTSILPHVDQAALARLAWDAYVQDPKGYAPLHDQVRTQVVPVFLCPSEGRQADGPPAVGLAWGLTSYKGIAGTGLSHYDGLFHKNYTVRFTDVTDGTSNTVMIGECPPGPYGVQAAWYAAWGSNVCDSSQILPVGRNTWIPQAFAAFDCQFPVSALRPGQPSNPCDMLHFWSLHPGGANFAFADGSVRFLPYSWSDVLPALATRAGGEIVPFD